MAELAVNDNASTDNARWNFGVSIWDVTFIMLGISLVSRETVMPVLVAQLTDSKLAEPCLAKIEMPNGSIVFLRSFTMKPKAGEEQRFGEAMWQKATVVKSAHSK